MSPLPLQVDVNEYWTVEEALDAPARGSPSSGVEYCEQPLPAGDPGGAALAQASPIPIYLDEDCHTLADVAECATARHGVNVKLAKSGGVREAVRMAAAARALGLGVMLGCMVESGSASPRPRTSRASSTTSTSTATSSSGRSLAGRRLRRRIQRPSDGPASVSERLSDPR